MDRLRIRGGRSLQGEVAISGSKNAALPVIISSLLTDQPCRYENVPDLHDIQTTTRLLEHLGVTVRREKKGEKEVFVSDASKMSGREAPYDLVRKMRASVLVLGPMLARFGEAKVSLPGGCAIGARPVDFHLEALRKLGAAITLDQGYVIAKALSLRGERVHFQAPSVGATENAMMAATLAKGETVLENCAQEPEIVDLARALRSMGAELEGEGTDTIRIQGKDSLGGASHSVMADRIEAGTYLAAGFATGGRVRAKGISPEFLEAVLTKFSEAGAKMTKGPDFIELESRGQPKAVDIITMPYPGFPTDMQAQFMAVMALASGATLIRETIFENRFMHVPELIRLGADITIRGNTALVRGKDKLAAAPLMATDLRASASLIIAALAAEGESIVSRIYHLDRGYERLEEKLSALGAQVERLRDPT